MNQPLTKSPAAEGLDTGARVSLTEMRVAQYRQRIEMLEASLSSTVAKQKELEKLVEHMQLRISATEQHCSWTTDRFGLVDERLRAQAPRPPLVTRLKVRVLYPLIRRGVWASSKVMGLAPGLRDAAAYRLYRDQKAVYNKLKQLRPDIFGVLEARTRIPAWQGLLDAEAKELRSSHVIVPPLKNVANTASAVEKNPALTALPRPLATVLETFSAAAEKQDEELKEVTRLGQVQAGASSVSFVVVIDGKSNELIDQTLQSVFRQTDPSWELLLCAGDGAGDMVAPWLERDWRIRRGPSETCEVRALVLSARCSTSMFVGLITPGDVVDDDLVKNICRLASRSKDVVAVYTDEARRQQDGHVVGHFYKPDWSPEHQLSVDVLGRFLAMRKQFLLNLPIEPWCELPVAEYLLSLRFAARKLSVAHLDEVMYLRDSASTDVHRRFGGGFVPEDIGAVGAEVQRYLRDEVDPLVTVVADKQTGGLRVRWPLPAEIPVTLVILTNMRYRNVERRGDILMVLNFVKSIIEKSTYPNYKIVVVDDGFVPEELSDLLEKHGHSSQTYRAEGAFSFAGKANFASSLASSGIVVLLNDDLEVIAEDWIEALVEQAARPEVGVVGGKLLFPDGSIQHAGISIGLNGSAGHVFMGQPSDEPEYAGYASVVRNYAAVTGALMAYRKEVFDSLGGFDEFFRVDYNDIDFCLRCVSKGYRVVFTPYAKLYHFHNSTFNRKHDMEHERAEFLRRWQSFVNVDPYCGPHLAPICGEYALQDDRELG